MRPFHGYMVTGMSFSSGHALFLINFSSTPVAVPAYSEIWLVTPSDERVLLVDPEPAGPIVARYHDFARILGSRTQWRWPAPDTLQVDARASDGTSLAVEVKLRSNVATGALNTILKVSPRAVMRTAPMMAVSYWSMNLMLGLDDLRIGGKTETGRRYRSEVDRLALVGSATARLNGADLGALGPPSRPIRFGDINFGRRAICTFGDLYLEDAGDAGSASAAPRAATG